jgi:SprT protein
VSDCADVFRRQLRAATGDWLKRAAPLLLERARVVPDVEVRCDLRGQSAGQLRRYADGRLVIRYNLSMAQLQPDAFLRETVPHEVAHVVTWLLYGKRARPHGREWQAVMRFFGFARPNRCHSFQTAGQSARRQRRWLYTCDCQHHQLSSTRHHRALQGQAYVCRNCQSTLRPVERGRNLSLF